jgi:hypothetical protein
MIFAKIRSCPFRFWEDNLFCVLVTQGRASFLGKTRFTESPCIASIHGVSAASNLADMDAIPINFPIRTGRLETSSGKE